MRSRIAVIVYSSFPGDVRVRREVEALVDAGYEVDVICCRQPSEPAREVISDATVHRLGVTRKRGTRLRYIFEYVAFTGAAFLAVAHAHSSRRYRVVHVHNLPAFLVLSALIPRLFGAKVILDLHDLMPEFYMRKYSLNEQRIAIRTMKLVERWSAALANHVIVASPYKLEKILDRSVEREKCTTVLNLPDPKYFGGSRSVGRSHDQFRMIYPRISERGARCGCGHSSGQDRHIEHEYSAPFLPSGPRIGV